jgi:hypothetical protein
LQLPADPTLVGLAGAVVGFYFGTRNQQGPTEEPLPEPFSGDAE